MRLLPAAAAALGLKLPPPLQGLFLTSIVLGAVACGSSLLLLWAALDSGTPGSLFAQLGLPPMPYGKITTMVYLKVRAGSGLRHPGQTVCSAGPATHALRPDHDNGVPQGEEALWPILPLFSLFAACRPFTPMLVHHLKSSDPSLTPLSPPYSRYRCQCPTSSRSFRHAPTRGSSGEGPKRGMRLF